MWVTIARHGETQGNLSDTLQGQLTGRLSATGWRQAHALADALKDRRFHVIFTTDLKRGLDTARVIAGFHEAPLIVDPLLRERHFGRYQRTSRSRFYGRERALPDPVRHRPAGGESLADLYDRAQRFVTLRLRTCTVSSILIVSHGDMIRMLLGVLQGLPVEQAATIRQTNGCVNVLRLSGAGWRVVRLNSLSHLDSQAQSFNASSL